MKNFLWLLIPFMVFAALPSKINAEFTTNDIKGVTKSVERPSQENGYFLIGTKTELDWYRDTVNTLTNNDKAVNAKLIADIDYEDGIWIPLSAGVGSPSFGGIFDGQGHTISNLKIVSDSLKKIKAQYQQNLGFVGPLKGTVKNLNLVNVYVKNTATGGTIPNATGGKEEKSISMGTVAGWVDPAGKIDSVTVTGEMWAYGDGQGVGGIAGNCHGKITNSTSSVTIHVINLSFVGGITGLTKKNVTISNVHWQGNIIIDNPADSSQTYIGGIIGDVYEGTATITNATFDSETVQNSIGRVNKGTVTADVLEYGIYTIKTKNNKKICELDGAYKYTVKDGVFTSNMTVDSLVFNRKFVPGKSSTFAVPFAIDKANITGAKFYKLDSVSNVTGTYTAYLSEETTKLVKDRPYIVVVDETNADSTISISGSYSLTSSTPGTTKSTDNNWELQSIYKYTTGADRGERRTKTYGFVARDTVLDGKQWHAGQFVKMGTKAYVYPFRVLLEFVGDVNSLPKSAANVFESEPEVIEVHFPENAMAEVLPKNVLSPMPKDTVTRSYFDKFENRVIIFNNDKKFTTNGKEIK